MNAVRKWRGVLAGILLVAASPAFALSNYWNTGKESYDAAIAIATMVKSATCSYEGGTYGGVRAVYHANSAAGYDDYDGQVLCGSRWRTPRCVAGNCNPYSAGRQYFPHLKYCPTGQTWVPATFTCLDPAVCLAKPPVALGGTANLTASPTRCLDGCRMVYQGGNTQMITTAGGSVIKIATGGSFKGNGEACSAGEPSSTAEFDPPNQACVTDAGTGKQLCVNKLGKQCFQLSSMSKEICWAPGETGEKVSGSELQKRNAGTTSITPQTPPPEGDTFTPQGTPQTASTEVKDNATATVTATHTTTVANYTTTSGVDASPDKPDSASPSTGADAGTGGSGSGSGEGDSQYPAGGTDGTTGSGGGDTAIWKTFDTSSILSNLNTAGWLGASSCPALPTFDIPGLGSYTPNPAWWCQIITMLAGLVMFCASIIAIVILMK